MREWDPARLYYRLPGSLSTKRRLARFIRARFRDPEAFLKEYEPGSSPELDRAYEALAKPLPDEEERIGLWRERYQLRVLGEEGYPEVLLELPDPPLFLFSLGNLQGVLTHEPRVVMVGTRNPTPYGARMAERLARELVELSASLGSGLARGVDGIAHRTALKQGGFTWAVLAHGCEEIYPPEHRELARAIVDQGGALVSEYPPETPVAPYQFPERNRILAALAQGVVVIEGSKKSGSLITAEWALELNREIFALPGRVGDPFAEGPLSLLEAGAHLALSGEKILSALGFTAPGKVKLPPTKELPSPHREVWESLSPIEPIHVDLIAQRLNRPVQELLNLLLELELKGYVQALPGKQYVRNAPP